jgi:hypothetical protein
MVIGLSTVAISMEKKPEITENHILNEHHELIEVLNLELPPF